MYQSYRSFASVRHWRHSRRRDPGKVRDFEKRKNRGKSKVNFSTSLRFPRSVYAPARLYFRVLSWIVWIELTLKYESTATNISLSRHILTQRGSGNVSLAPPRRVATQPTAALRRINNPGLDVWDAPYHTTRLALSLELSAGSGILRVCVHLTFSTFCFLSPSCFVSHSFEPWTYAISDHIYLIEVCVYVYATMYIYVITVSFWINTSSRSYTRS